MRCTLPGSLPARAILATFKCAAQASARTTSWLNGPHSQGPTTTSTRLLICNSSAQRQIWPKTMQIERAVRFSYGNRTRMLRMFTRFPFYDIASGITVQQISTMDRPRRASNRRRRHLPSIIYLYGLSAGRRGASLSPDQNIHIFSRMGICVSSCV